MEHVLNNPVWTALTTGNANLALGNEQVKYYPHEVAAFVGLKENSTHSLHLLYDATPNDGPHIVITPHKLEIPKQWKLARYLMWYQMIYDITLATPTVTAEPVLLTDEDIPQMMELTKLTNPGPFFERTIDFGHYYGLFDGDKLIAMAGQRMHSTPYAEISAVCTHPDYLGRGYARQLLLHQIHRIRAAGGLPYLHVRDDNERPFKIYESMGFVTRKALHFYVLVKNDDLK
jgi:ribosomal protein S18 acetylase RimI-like enzyme